MFIKKETKIDLQQLLEESQKQLLAAQEGQFDYKIDYAAKDSCLQQIIDNFNQINVLREEY